MCSQICTCNPVQFDVTNTLNDQLLEDVRVEMEEPEGFSLLTYVPIPKLPYGHPATTYTLVEMNDPTTGNGREEQGEIGVGGREE